MNLDSLGFKFKIGEIVRHRMLSKTVFIKNKQATHVLITGRIANEYLGGVQLQYDVRVGSEVTNAGETTFDPRKEYRVHELELERIPEEKEEE